MDELKPTKSSPPKNQKIFVHKDLKSCTHVFVRVDRVRKALEPPYDGPFPVKERYEKYFTLTIKNKPVNISADRLKPAYLLMTDSIPDKTTVPCRQSDENSAANDTNLLTDVKPTVSRHGRLVKKPITRLATVEPNVHNSTKPYIIRTDASNYALGAVLLQGEGSDEHPIEYASRLLSPAERNYSTTEREALAVVWALKKFRGYIEGTEITVASDHQPLKWLLNLKSPTGRLARWALEIQSFNLKVQYIPGKANVVAHMLSRPVTQEEESFCEENNITIADMPT
ncbi:retrovirus-related Pol polyprotein from transposon 297 [Trichonephila clavipes]|nr:retrovirus-related Pol polyprotein from transposon 297 [Trichonephila clavipes]